MSRPRCWPNSIRRLRRALAAAAGLAVFSGCAVERSQPLRPAFADAVALARRHPGRRQLEAIQGEIARLRQPGAALPGGFALAPAVFEPREKSSVTRAGSASSMGKVVEVEMRLLDRQLRSKGEVRLKRVAQRLKAAERQAVAGEQDRLEVVLGARLREIETRWRAGETALVLRMEAAQRRLGQSALAVGERTQAELERAEAEGDLKELRERKHAQAEAAKRETRSALETFAAAEGERAAQALAVGRQRVEGEVAQALAREREALERQGTGSAPRPGAGGRQGRRWQGTIEGVPAGQPAARALTGDEVARLERLRARIGSMASEQTKAAAVLVGRRHGLDVRFRRSGAEPAEDVTARMAQWLDDYWRAGAQP